MLARVESWALAIALTSLPACAATVPTGRAPASATSGLEIERSRTREEGTAKQATRTPPAPASSCEADLPRIRDRLQLIASAPRAAVDRGALPSVAADAHFTGGSMQSCPVLSITADAVLWDGAPVSGADDAARARAITAAWGAARRGRPRPTQLCVAAPAQLPLARLDALVGRLDVVLLATAARRPSTIPGVEEAVRSIEGRPAAERCRAYGDALEHAARECEPARAALRALVATTPACTATPTQGAGVNESRAVTEALATCHCGGADLLAIVGLYERAADRTTDILRTFPLREDVDGGSAAIAGAIDGPAMPTPTVVVDRIRALERQVEPID